MKTDLASELFFDNKIQNNPRDILNSKFLLKSIQISLNKLFFILLKEPLI
jgi:hypothetical protein